MRPELKGDIQKIREEWEMLRAKLSKIMKKHEGQELEELRELIREEATLLNKTNEGAF